MKSVSILCLIFFATLAGTTAPMCAETWEGPCEEEYTHWTRAVANLRESMDVLGKTKQESLRSDILDAVSRADRRVTTARIVQSFLDIRNRALAQQAEKCREVGDRERFAFDDLKRCVHSASRRRSNSSPALGALAKDRDKLVAELRNLLLDEAYVQYKGDRDAIPPSAYSDAEPRPRASYEGQSPWNQRPNYGAPNYFAPRGYYGN